MALLALTLSAAASTETMMHSFNQKPNGANSEAGLVADSAGNLYGTTLQGGAYGVVFRLSRNSHGTWVQTVLHNFTGGYNGPDGAGPASSVTFDAAGNLYGTTSAGGTYGCGTVYKLAPGTGPWKETILHSFACYPSDGYRPDGSVIFDAAGNLYGVTNAGGSGGCGDGYTTYGCGAVYELSPTSNGYVETILYSFATNNNFESNPAGALAFDKSGNLYGTASSGGTGTVCYYYGCGTVFKLTKGSSAWTESTIYDFTGVTDGDTPVSGVVIDAAGNLYGTTEGYWGYGSVFELSPSSGGTWTETTLYSTNPTYAFLFGAPVFDAAGNIYVSENVYSNTGCTGTNCGNVLKLSHSSSGWTATTIYGFTGAKDGEAPYGTLLFDAAGNLYTTTAGGANGAGAVDKLSPASGSWKATVLYDFPVLTEGTVPYSGLTADGAGNYYGTTTKGGTLSGGTVFKLSPNGTGGWKETVIYNFTGISGTSGDGAIPVGNLIFDPAGNLYGMTQAGGKYTTGCDRGSSNECGTVFRLAPNGDGTWTESVIYAFTGYGTGDGDYPAGGLVMDSSGNLFGTTEFGGAKDAGIAFKLTPSSGGTWTETVLYTFGNSVTDSSDPTGPLALDSQGNLYGTGSAVSSGGYPTVFRLSPSSGGYTESILFTFTTQNEGYQAAGGVILDGGGNLYGITYRGGLYEGGLVYKLTP